ncbi:MAG TPA: O-methyltransferase [Pyrinomonadaceae bacterium]
MPSFETLDYSIRQNKAIERYLMVTIIKRMWSEVNFFNDAAYIGMGSIWFKDFEVMNLSLGIQYSNMYSIEYPSGVERARWNRNQINQSLSVVPGPVQAILIPDEDWSQSLRDKTAQGAAVYNPKNRKIIWFDYEQPPNSDVMWPVGPASDQLNQPGDVLILTFATGYERLERAAQRYLDFFIKAQNNRQQLVLLRMKRFLQREDRYYEDNIFYLKQDMFDEIKSLRNFRADKNEGRRVDWQVLNGEIERFISDELDSGVMHQAKIKLRFMIEVTAFTFEGEHRRDRVRAYMLKYLESKVIEHESLNELYTGAVAFALLREISGTTKQPLETLFNLVYNDGTEMITIALTYRDESLQSPGAILLDIFGECRAYYQALGIEDPLRITVPAITSYERQYLRTLSVERVTEWLNDYLTTRVGRDVVKGIQKFPFFPALVQLYPSIKDVTSQLELAQVYPGAMGSTSANPLTVTVTGQTSTT